MRDPRRASGWHPPATPTMGWQWTDGNATLLTDGARVLEFRLAKAGSYLRCPLGDPPDVGER